MKFYKKLIQKFTSLLGIQIIKKRNRNFDKIIIELYELLEKQPKVIFDVGAHNGSSIIRFSNLFKASSIWSFEPNIEMFQQLEAKFFDYKLHLFNKGLDEKPGNPQFNVHKTSTGSSSMLKFKNHTKFSKRRNLYKNTKKVKIETTTLDLFTKEHKIKKIDILKIDTQGTELEVLKGSINLLKQEAIDLIEMEIIIAEVYEKQHNWSEVISFLDGLNYQLIALSNDGRFYNMGPFDLLKNPELQFDCLFVNKNVYIKLERMLNK
jgi:FkbM family methyltransferase